MSRNPFDRWWRRRRGLGRRTEEDVRAELQFHLERRTEEYIQAGLSPAEARRVALGRFGDLDRFQRECREIGNPSRRPQSAGGLTSTLWQDARYGLRMMARNPGFAAVAVLTLALGIGATTAVFSVVNGVLLRPLPYADPDRLVLLWAEDLESTKRGWRSTISYEYHELRSRNDVLTDMVAHNRYALDSDLTGDGELQRVWGAHVSEGFFSLLGVQPFLGRKFLPEEVKRGAEPVVIISHRLWRSRYGGDPDVVGKRFTGYWAGREDPYTIVGVMPAGFRFPADGDFWVPFDVSPRDTPRGKFYFAISELVARLKPGVNLRQAQAHMSVLASRQRGWRRMGREIRMVPLQERVVGKVRGALLLFLGAVALVLVIACANVANLLLSRGAGREREVAIRAVLGAGRLRLVRQLLTENLLLAGLGGAAGLLLAYAGVKLFLGYNPGNLPRLEEIGLDWTVLAFTTGVSLLTGLLFGLVPAQRASKPDLTAALKNAGTTGFASSVLGGRRLRSVLVVAETALAMVLLVGAGLLLHSFMRMMLVGPGFNPQNLLTVSLVRSRSAAVVVMPDSQGVNDDYRYRDLLERIEAVGGVEGATVSSALPPSRGAPAPLTVMGRSAPDSPEMPLVDLLAVSPGYFRALEVPLVQGRLFEDVDIQSELFPTIVNQELVRRYFDHENPIGKRIDVAGERQIVGVVSDVLQRGLDAPSIPIVYIPTYGEGPTPGIRVPLAITNVVVRTTADPLALAGTVRSLIESSATGARIQRVTALESTLWQSIAGPRFYSLLSGCFGALALLLAAVGTYGVLSYSVSRRTHEIGVRVALGARPADILRIIMGEGLVLTLVGVGIGVAGAFATTRLLSGYVFGVSATDPLTFAAVAAVLLLAALLALYFPARRATRVDPMVALRYE